MMGDISVNFSLWEFECPCGCGFNSIDLRLMPIMEAIREHEGGKPMKPSSACRCVKYNEKIQKQVNPKYISFSSQSRHLDGIAVDIKSNNPYELYKFLDNLFPHIYGIGVYDWGIHLDTRPYKARWDNRT